MRAGVEPEASYFGWKVDLTVKHQIYEIRLAPICLSELVVTLLLPSWVRTSSNILLLLFLLDAQSDGLCTPNMDEVEIAVDQQAG
ncbi:uncharacterized protein YALI1_F36936g [Yarrowia lipolytica]|uniref:Uncharacterized protein n=1 Tax=Yarrowia lipolytica TaxID=4952 RepID=A0A1D8NQF3_YARLL|nr:hypothetical protein YALI1_F36936g [Yarrowia lipolytica]